MLIHVFVVSREIIRIKITYDLLIVLEVMSVDIKNSYLQAPTSEKHYVIYGPEFVIDNVGKVSLITRALYVGKLSTWDF